MLKYFNLESITITLCQFLYMWHKNFINSLQLKSITQFLSLLFELAGQDILFKLYQTDIMILKNYLIDLKFNNNQIKINLTKY